MNKVLSYILIALLVAVLLHLIFKTVNKSSCKKEKTACAKPAMPEIKQENSSWFSKIKKNQQKEENNVFFDNNNDRYNNILSDFLGDVPDGQIGHANFNESQERHYGMGSMERINYGADDNSNNTQSTDANESPDSSDFNSGIGIGTNYSCSRKNTDAAVDNYIKEYALYGRTLCTDEKNKDKTYNSKDIDIYRQNQLEFNNNINRSSSGVDMVDRVNELYLAGNGDCAKRSKGKTIAEAFDDMTKVYKTDADKSCIIKPEIDRATLGTHYMKPGHGAGTYVGHHLRYSSDDVNTGGLFYGDVEGYDESADHSMAV